MSRPVPTTYVPLAPQSLGVSSSIGTTAEATLSANIHHAYVDVAPTMIATVFASDIAGDAGVQPYVIGLNPASTAINAMWHTGLPFQPFTELTVTVLYSNTGTTSPADDHTIRFDWASDPWVTGTPATGTFVDLVAVTGTSEWGVATGTLTVPPLRDEDVLRMWAINTGSAGVVRVHSVDVRPKAPTAISAGKESFDSIQFFPLDTAETDADSPLTVAHRQAQWDDCEYIRRTRPGWVLGWSENTQFRAGSEAFFTTSSDYERVITLPFRAPHGVTEMRYAFFGYMSAGTGSVKLTTATDASNEVTESTASISTSWASPYSPTTWEDGGALAVLGVTPGAWDELRVDIKSDGTNTARLMSICAWFYVTEE